MRLKLDFAPITPALSFWLDVVRGLAALVVLVGHVRERFFGNYGADFTGAPDVVTKVFFVLFGMGTQAVMCFFVMSGLLIAPKFLKGSEVTAPVLREYTIARLTRLFVVAVPALLLSMFVAHLATVNFGGFPTVLSDQCRPTAKDLVINLALLSKAFYPVICSNAPFWSIHNEAFYYALWPAMIIAVSSANVSSRIAAGALLAVATVSLVIWDPADIHNTLLLFPVWILGGLTLAFPRPQGGPWLWGLLAMLAVIVPNLLPYDSTYLIEDYVLAAMLVLFLRSVAGSTFSPPGWLKGSAKWLADISFSLYLSHIFLVDFVRGYLQFGEGMAFPLREFNSFSVALYVGTTLGCLVLAQMFYWAFEKHTPTVRKRVSAYFAPQKSASLSASD